jgi:hypothetical protein
MENINKKPKKSLFISKQIRDLNDKEKEYFEKLQKVLCKESDIETIGYITSDLSYDKKERPLVLSREIVDKIEGDHGPIPAPNMIVNIFDWEYATMNVLGNPDKINLIKNIPNSDNYLLIAAIRINGFFVLTYFETEANNGNNLKRLLDRGSVINRVSSIACTTDQDLDSSQTREVI